MKANRFFVMWAVVAVALLATVSASAQASQDLQMITTEDLVDQLGASDLMILDVRHIQHWESSSILIKGAVRRNPTEFASWAHELPRDKRLVLY